MVRPTNQYKANRQLLPVRKIYKMSKNILFLSLLLSELWLMSCKEDVASSTIDPKLNRLLESYITTESPDSIITLTFSEINGMELLSFSDGVRYDPRRVDFYFKRRDKLIIIYKTQNIDLSRFLNKDSLKSFNGKISGYTKLNDNNGYVSSYDDIPKVIVYQITASDSFTTKISKIDDQYIAIDNNAIRFRDVNKVINDYINENPSVLYLLKMKRINGTLYFVFEKSQFYEKKDLDGYFYRNKHLIALYNVDTTLINKDEIIQHKNIKGFKEHSLGLDWMLNMPIYFKISNNTLCRFNDNFKLMFKISN